VGEETQTAVLVRRAQKGEATAFAELSGKFLRPAYSVALAIVGRPADAEDVAQDAFILALRHIDSCREPEKFVGWFLQIVRNQARNWLDKRRLRDVSKDSELPDTGHDESLLESSAIRKQLLSALQEISPVQREIVLLHDMEGWTHPEIAEALGLNELVCRQHLFQGRKRLRYHLDKTPYCEVDHG
jgi:RNA polymerase sigma-70 factor (ECF subfamily)